MLRNGHRLCRVLHRGWVTRWRIFSSAKTEQSLNNELNQANEGVVKREADDETHETVLGHDQTRISKAIVKRPKPLTREPFIKNLFLGKFDTNMLIFPEMIEKHEVEDLNQFAEEIERFFKEKVDSQAIDREGKIPDDVLQQLKDFGMFGLQIPQEYGGLEFNATQLLRMAEVTSNDPAIDVTLGAHQSMGLKGILMYGTDEQKAKYLPRLASGEHVAAFCLTESCGGSDFASVQTTATLSDDGKTYILNGEKIFITNGSVADVFTVFAKTKITATTGAIEYRLTAFIVERAFGGVTNGRPEDKHGIRGSDVCSVTFDNTPVPVENVIGDVGNGFRIAQSVLNSGRFTMGAASAAGIRRLLAQTVEHAISRKQFDRPLTNFGQIQLMLANIEMDAYMMESMGYVTAGILDSVIHPDAAVESAIVKVFSSEATLSATNQCLQIMGGHGYMKTHPYERHVRDARVLSIHEGTNEMLRLFISLTCLQHAGLELIEMVKKMRDPLNNLSFTFKKQYERMQTQRKNPKLLLALYDHVHPDLSFSAESLEMRVVRYRYIIEKYLAIFGDKLVEEQMALKRIADVAIDLYAMTSVLARASRSKSIGLQHCDHEVLIATVSVANACTRADQNLDDLDEAKFSNGDEEVRQIAEYMFKHGGYIPRHPLTRNW